METIVAHYLELMVAIRRAREEVQQITVHTPSYAPSPWLRQVDELLSCSLLMADASQIAYETWLSKKEVHK